MQQKIPNESNRIGVCESFDVCTSQFIDHTLGLASELKSGLLVGHSELLQFMKRHGSVGHCQVYMGRGPSNDPHLAHIIVWQVGLKIQKQCGSHVLFQLADDEKYYASPGKSIEPFISAGEIYPRILANMGFLPSKTHVFSNWENMGYLYETAAKKLAKKIKLGTICALFGFNKSNTIGSIFFGLVEISVCLWGDKSPMIVVTGMDQAPFFKLYNQLARRHGFPIVAVLYVKTITNTSGRVKMSSRGDSSKNILVTDDLNAINKKLKKALSGAEIRLSEHKKKGINSQVDWAFQIAKHLSLPHIALANQRYLKGQMRSDNYKKRIASAIHEYFGLLLCPNHNILKCDISKYHREPGKYTIMGIDQAGKGALLGDMFVAAAIDSVSDLDISIDSIGLKISDSKKMSPSKRSVMYHQIKNQLEIDRVRYTPKEIDKQNLNDLLFKAHVSLINRHSPDLVIIDCPIANTISYECKLKAVCPKPQYVIENHADENYKIVSAASIVAKVERDCHISKMSQIHGFMGSGNPSDPKTIAFVKNHRQSPLIRQKWKISF